MVETSTFLLQYSQFVAWFYCRLFLTHSYRYALAIIWGFLYILWWLCIICITCGETLKKILNLNLNLLCRYIFLSSITQKTLTSRDWVPMPASYKKQEQISPRGHLYFLISVLYLFWFYISILFSVPNVAWVPELFFLGCPFFFPYRLLTRLKIKPKWSLQKW